MMRPIKVALIGNMNNNHFAMMRYLLDSGHQVKLLLFNNELELFAPEADTWHINQYNDCISQLRIGNPVKDFLFFRDNLSSQLKEIEIVIGCGLAPYYINNSKLRLDIFIPYGSDLYETPFKKIKIRGFKSVLAELFNRYKIRKLQMNGIKESRRVIILDLFKTYSIALNKMKLQSLKLHVPIVYTEKDASELPDFIMNSLNRVGNNFVLIQHCRQYWSDPLDSGLTEDVKHNNRLIEAINLLVKNKEINIRCIFLEYGPDVQRSKELIRHLGIDKYFIWLPKMPRKFLLKIIQNYTHIGVDQFGGGYFGGSGYEILACGKPLMNAVSITPEKYKEITGFEFPPIINVSTVEEIANAIAYYIGAPDELAILGLKSKNWFDKNCGTGLIETYIKIFEEIISEKTKELHA